MMEDHELIALTQQYDKDRDGVYVCHTAYEQINQQVAAGRPWAKCVNCGQPYPRDRKGSGPEMCSTDCENSYLLYLNDEVTRAW